MGSATGSGDSLFTRIPLGFADDGAEFADWADGGKGFDATVIFESMGVAMLDGEVDVSEIRIKTE